MCNDSIKYKISKISKYMYRQDIILKMFEGLLRKIKPS